MVGLDQLEFIYRKTILWKQDVPMGELDSGVAATAVVSEIAESKISYISSYDRFIGEQNAKKLGYTYEDISRLENLIEEKITTGRTNKFHLKNGAKNAAKIINEMIW